MADSTLLDIEVSEPSAHRATEYYSTNPDDVRAFLDVVPLTVDLDPRLAALVAPGSRIFDPCAGGCDRNVMPYPAVLRERKLYVTTMDIRRDSRAEIIGDFLRDPLPSTATPFDGVCSNPPFRLFREFVQRAHEVLEDEAVVAFLLPVRCQEPRSTYPSDVDFWREFRPAWQFTHPRLKFGGATSRNAKNSSAFDHYAHFLWVVGGGDQVTRCRPVSDAIVSRQGAMFGGAA